MGIQKGDSPMDAAHLILVIFEGKILFSELIFIFIKNCWFYGKLKQWKQCQTLFWGGGSKITADGDCSHEINRRLLLRRKVLTNLDSILKNRDINSDNKGPSIQSCGFHSSHVWM